MTKKIILELSISDVDIIQKALYDRSKKLSKEIEKLPHQPQRKQKQKIADSVKSVFDKISTQL